MTFAAVSTLILLLAGCGSLGGILGDQGSTYPSSQSSNLVGTVNNVDTRNQRIDLLVDDYNGTRRNTTVYYDNNTQVTYQGQYGKPTQLERGDRVEVRLSNNGVANSINVIQGMASNYPDNTYPSSQNGSVRGTVSYVDTRNQRIDITPSYGTGLRDTRSNNTYTVYYDNNTRVMYQGRDYRPTDLERGDQVEVRVFDNGNSRYLADTITVLRNVRQ